MLSRSTYLSWVVLCSSLAFGSVGADEIVVHEFDRLKISGLRPSTKATLLNQEVTAENIREEPEFVLITQDFDLIGDFLNLLHVYKPPVSCPLQQDFLWVADFASEGVITTFTGGRDFVVVSDGTCRSIEGLSIGRILE